MDFWLWTSADTDTALGSTRVMTLDGTGNVGIGTSTPSSSLVIKSNIYFDEGGGNYDNGPDIRFSGGGLLAADGALVLNFDAVNAGGGIFSIRKGGNTTSATEIVRINNNGNVGIGTTAPTSKLTVEGAGVVANIGGNSGGILQVRQINGKSAASAANDVLFLNYGTGFNVNVGGGAGTSLLTVFGPGSTCTLGNGTGATNCTSDARLKKDIQPISGALEKLALIKGVTFHWKDPKRAELEHLGVIAQDVEKVFPQAVTTISDTTLPGGTAKAVDYAVLVAPLIEAVKELKARNEALQADVEAIQADFAAYKAAHP